MMKKYLIGLRDSLLEINEEFDVNRNSLIMCEIDFEKTVSDVSKNVKQSNEILLRFLPSIEEATESIIINTGFVCGGVKRKR